MDPRGVRVAVLPATCVLLAFALGCFTGSDGQAPGAGQSGAGTGVGGSGVGGVGGTGGAPGGSGGGVGTGGVSAGGVGGVSGGASGVGGATGGTGGAGGDSAGAGGNAGGGGTTVGDPSCDTDADCEICVSPISPSLPCCPGCPVVMSNSECDAVAATMKACGGEPMPLCPIASCLAPGIPRCEGNVCVSGDGIGDADCKACTRSLDETTCGAEQPVHWQCFDGPPSKALMDNCSDRVTAIPRYCCASTFGTSCGDF